jgi:hypothetical protein
MFELNEDNKGKMKKGVQEFIERLRSLEKITEELWQKIKNKDEKNDLNKIKEIPLSDYKDKQDLQIIIESIKRKRLNQTIKK